jgi:hypothetical protein
MHTQSTIVVGIDGGVCVRICACSCLFAGAGAPHMLLQQASNVLLAVVAALSLESAAGGPSTRPGAMLQLLKAQELQAQLDAGGCCASAVLLASSRGLAFHTAAAVLCVLCLMLACTCSSLACLCPSSAPLRLLPAAVSKPEDGFAAVVALAWALAKDAVISRTGPEAGGAQQQQQQPHGHDSSSMLGPPATALLEAAGRARALGTLSAILGSVAFRLEAEEEHRCVWMWVCVSLRGVWVCSLLGLLLTAAVAAVAAAHCPRCALLLLLLLLRQAPVCAHCVWPADRNTQV